MPAESVVSRRSFLKLSAFSALAGPHLLKAAAPERSLSFYNLHTAEKLNVVYWADGGYVPQALVAIDHHLRDYRSGEIHAIDSRLLDLLHELHSKLETTEPIQIISGYR